jgi:hypothetical protein
MTLTLFILWLLLSLGITAIILHQVGQEFGAHVALSASTRVAVFMAAATIVGMSIGFVRWLVL